ncbi:gag-pol polyprotein [Tanacetum coccineum]
MAETMEQYMSKTRADDGSGIARPKIEDNDTFELKSQFLKELRDNTFNGSDHEDANEHIEKVLEIMDLFHIPNITIDQVMLRAFPMSLTGAASRWLRNKPSGSITTWEDLKTKFLSKYYPPARTAKKMEEINNFQQEPDENLYQAWERFKELLMKCPQHYLTEMQEVVLFYNGLDVPTRQILDSRGVIPSKTTADAKVAIHTSYTKDCPLKEEGKNLEEAYYTQFGAPFQGGGYRATALGFYQRNNANPSYQERRQSMEDTLSKFMNFIILNMPEDIKVPLILGRPFLSTTRAKIDVFKRKITLRVRQERIIFKSVKPASSLIKRVYMLSLRERMELDLEARLMGETLLLSRSLDPFFEDYIELNDLNVPLELRRDQVDDLMPTIEEGEEFRARNDARMVSKIFGYPRIATTIRRFVDLLYSVI